MIDLRSDLCSVPTEEMWEAMRKAELGWATVGEDASVNELCARVAELLGKPTATWVPTCGMANLAALLTFCQPGDHVVLESASHVLTSEAMGITEIARLQPAPVWAEDGRMDPAEVEELVASRARRSCSSSRTRTRGPAARPSRRSRPRRSRPPRSGTAAASTSTAPGSSTRPSPLGVPLADLAAPANSVVISLNKSLSAPFGAVLAGSEAVVERAKEMLHRLGGASFHRAGIAAAAGLVALDTMFDRVADDHRRARSLGGGSRGDPGRDAAAGAWWRRTSCSPT